MLAAAVSKSDRGRVLHWVDAAKGIGIILVVFGHLLYGSDVPLLNRFIYSFHMPLFFVLSGFLQKERKRIDEYIKRVMKRLLCPFILYAIVGVPFFGFLWRGRYASTLNFLMDSFYVNGKITNNPLWYLAVLFEIHLLMTLLKITERKIKSQLIILVFCLLGGFLVYHYRKQFYFFNLFGLNRMIVCSGFYIIGIVLRKIEISSRQWAIMAIPSLIMTIIFGLVLNTKVSIYGFSLGVYYYFVIAAISGCIFVFAVSNLFLNKKNCIEFPSQYGVLLIGTQYFVIVPFRMVMKRALLTKTIYYDCAMIIVALFVLIVIPLIYNKAKERFKIIKIMNGEI